MFSNIKKIWTDHGFEIVLGLCISFILIFGLYRRISGGKGTWSKQQYYSLPSSKDIKPNRQPPQESKGETECRRVLEYLFKKPFNKARPDFLRNPVTGGNFNLELDCFNPELGIAVEYNGIQHYQYVPYFHKNKEAFLNQKYRDQMKSQMCKENKVLLIEVPHTIKLKDIKAFIEKELRRNNIINKN
jgi:hypothetical protein